MKTFLLFLIFLFLCAGSSWATVNSYTFTGSSGTYIQISGGTMLGTAGNYEQVFNNNTIGEPPPVTNTGFPIGFTFNYNGTDYDKFAVNTNGWIVLGTGTFTIGSVTASYNYTPISTTGPVGFVNAISPLGMDLQGQSGAELSYLSSGVAPSRVLVIQWKGYRCTGASSESFNFQIRLNETSNTVQFVYGAFTKNSSTRLPQVGIRGADNTDFHNRATTTAWASTTKGTVNTDFCLLTPTIIPGVGLTFTFTPIVNYDYGDAPSPYPTLLAANGARHINTGLKLGPLIDVEANGLPDPNALGDDNNNLDDEDGVWWPYNFVPGHGNTIRITASAAGYMNAWIDFNKNNSWADAGEQIFINTPVVAGINDLSMTVPAGAVLGTTFGRFRFSTQQNLSYTGLASNGEVEDYILSIQDPEYMDYGDAPDSYRTLAASNGARHGSTGPNVFMGVLRDLELNGQPTVNALGDDNNPAGNPDDEDGVIFNTSMIPGQVATVTVTVNMLGAFLQGWVDFNGDGDFTDAGEQIITNVNPPALISPYSFNVPVGATLGTTYARFRYATMPNIASFGPAPNGEVEDYQVSVTSLLDYGDAPAPYPTLLVNDGARHTNTGLKLGLLIDVEQDGLPDPNALGDDNNNLDDEDGIWWPYNFVPGHGNTIRVTASAPGYLNAWIDFNKNGSWAEANEKIFTNQLLASGVNDLSMLVPATAIAGTTFARFRFSTQQNLSYTGLATDGEVEDYQITIQPAEEMDYGDAPDSYRTLAASNGARHGSTGPNVFMGNLRDLELNGQPTVNALGDDINPLGNPDDEDGVIFNTSIIPGQVATITVTVNMLGPFQQGWIDFNGDGDFTDVGEQIIANVSPAALISQYNFNVPAGATLGTTFARFRYATMPNIASFGPAPNGEVEDYCLAIGEYDFGDAPSPYPTLLTNDGARHTNTGLKLGLLIDAEQDGLPDPNALGDDNNKLDDEDGVWWPCNFVPGHKTTIKVTASGAGVLNAWFDFNANGSWADPGEQIFTNTALIAGVNKLKITVPAGVAVGATFARFRFSTQQNLSYTGLANDGEVEDYQFVIDPTTPMDYGDNPDPAYPTLAASDGARHATGPPAGVFMGNLVDYELDGQPNAFAAGDVPDEDGVKFLAPLKPGVKDSVTITVSMLGPLLQGWIDFNGDGDWDEAGEQILTNVNPTALTANYVFNVPVGAVVGKTYSRFRFSTMPNLSYDGCVGNGEVEDYMVYIGEYDLGDAPDPTYPTLLASNGAIHKKSALFMGVRIDAEPDGQPNANATGDDNIPIGLNDEDGVWWPCYFTPGHANTIKVTTTGPGFLNAWIDYNRDGDWADPGEHIFTNVALLAGTTDLNVTVPGGASFGSTFARFRFSSQQNLTYTGYALDGEVEDYAIEIIPAQEMDYGDAPDPGYPTLAASNGARHINMPSVPIFLGNLIDWEMDGQPNAQANGDDLNNLADEDGVVFNTPLVPGIPVSITVTASIGGGSFQGWIDFNQDGDWMDAGEQIFTNTVLVAGVQTLTFNVPAGAVLGNTFARFRYSTMPNLSYYGCAPNGEVEDYKVMIQEMLDYGDAPDPTYPTLLASDGARHHVGGATFLGNKIDTEINGQPSTMANGDDLNNLDDEDGVTFLWPLAAGNPCKIKVNASVGDALLNVWIDYNRDGDWADLNEQVFTDKNLVAGDNYLTFIAPANVVPGTTFARFRFSHQMGLSYTGYAYDGEVEDYAVDISQFGDIKWQQSFETSLPGLHSDQAGWVADDWICGGGQVTDIHWWGNYELGENGEERGQGINYFLINIYSNANCLPGNVMQTYTVPFSSVSEVNTGFHNSEMGTIYYYEYDLSQPFNQIQGTIYWISIQAISYNPDPPFNACWRWQEANRWYQAISCGAADRTLPSPWMTIYWDWPPPGKYSDMAFAITSQVQTLLDYGDAPDPYPTLLANDGARHTNTGLKLGNLIDIEPNGIPNATATGDDLNNLDDEDGVWWPCNFVPGHKTTIQVTASGAGLLNAWFDFNANGSWADPGDQIFTNTALVAGVNKLSITVPSTAVIGSTFARFRFSTQQNLSFTGLANDGEVEDYQFVVDAATPMDYGDAPDPAYPTLAASNGARHGQGPPAGVFMGNIVDYELDGQPNAFAAGDVPDEDGVKFLAPLKPGVKDSVTITVSMLGPLLQGWIDFNADGDWSDLGEQILTNVTPTALTAIYVFNVPAGAVLGKTYARFRFSTMPNLSYDGCVGNGEVEDYMVYIGEYDLGDAPDPSYPTLLASNGAIHKISALFMGVRIDAEPNGQPNATSTGDDNNPSGLNDEDGVWWPCNFVPGHVNTVKVTTTGPGFLNAWIDYNIDGDWADSGEHVFLNVFLSAGTSDLSVTVPLNANIGSTYARFRFSSQPNLSYTGFAFNGEVEDYSVIIEAPQEMDYGDAPDTYKTLAASNGARHHFDPLDPVPVLLGNLKDLEMDGQPSPLANGDDNNNLPDEDGVVFNTPLIPGQPALITVTASIAGAAFQGWIDYNADGDWSDPGEQIFTNAILIAGPQPLIINVPATAVLGNTYARFRYSTMRNLSYYGCAPNGEVEDYRILIGVPQPTLDFGDAPDPAYPTLFVNNGARHFVNGVMYLGAGVDAELDGQPIPPGMGDDNNGIDDEDGVTFDWPLVPGNPAKITVVASTNTGFLNAWFDFNADGDWSDPGEQVFTNLLLNTGSNNLHIMVPLSAIPGFTYARFRYSSQPGISYTGPAIDGEVEDYQVAITTDPDKKWAQYPDVSLPGIHAHDAIIPPYQSIVLADDWQCNGGQVTDIQWWGNYEVIGGIEQKGSNINHFHISIHNPNGATCLPTDPEVWGANIPFSVILEQNTGLVNSDGSPIYFYEYSLPIPFDQIAGNNYWLDISAFSNDPNNPTLWRWQEAMRSYYPILCGATAKTNPNPGTWSTIVWNTFNPQKYSDMAFIITCQVPKTLNINVLLEGLYAGGGTMNQAFDEFGPHFQADTADMITVELHNSITYTNIEYAKSTALSTSGTSTVEIPGNKNDSYYLTIKHRNSIETTSALPVDFSGATISYAFNTQAQAYGSNMGLMIDGTAVIFVGDENQDQIVDGTDLSEIGNLADIAASGYLPQDINGDGLVDGSDLSATGNNADLAVGAILP